MCIYPHICRYTHSMYVCMYVCVHTYMYVCVSEALNSEPRTLNPEPLQSFRYAVLVDVLLLVRGRSARQVL